MSGPASDRILRAIAERGPITFAEYMELALYSEDGFFARAPVGREFATSVHVSPVFAALVARAIADAHEALDAPAAFTVADLGAGDGLLARRVLAAGLPPGTRYVAVERSPAARAQVAAAGIEVVADLADLGTFDGCVVANELFDNLPFHRLRAGADVADGVAEVRVGAEHGRLVEMLAPPSVAATRAPEPGEDLPVSPEAGRMVERVARTLRRGVALVFDYGFVAGEPVEPVRGYRAHRAVSDLLAEPGAHDITGPVDFDALAAAARAAGLEVWGPISQRDALLNLGYRDALDRMRGRQREAETAGEWRAAIEAFGARGDASMLVDPAGLGALKFLALATPGLRAPSAAGRGTPVERGGAAR